MFNLDKENDVNSIHGIQNTHISKNFKYSDRGFGILKISIPKILLTTDLLSFRLRFFRSKSRSWGIGIKLLGLGLIIFWKIFFHFIEIYVFEMAEILVEWRSVSLPQTDLISPQLLVFRPFSRISHPSKKYKLECTRKSN